VNLSNYGKHGCGWESIVYKNKDVIVIRILQNCYLVLTIEANPYRICDTVRRQIISSVAPETEEISGFVGDTALYNTVPYTLGTGNIYSLAGVHTKDGTWAA